MIEITPEEEKKYINEIQHGYSLGLSALEYLDDMSDSAYNRINKTILALSFFKQSVSISKSKYVKMGFNDFIKTNDTTLSKIYALFRDVEVEKNKVKAST